MITSDQPGRCDHLIIVLPDDTPRRFAAAFLKRLPQIVQQPCHVASIGDTVCSCRVKPADAIGGRAATLQPKPLRDAEVFVEPFVESQQLSHLPARRKVRPIIQTSERLKQAERAMRAPIPQERAFKSKIHERLPQNMRTFQSREIRGVRGLPRQRTRRITPWLRQRKTSDTHLLGGTGLTDNGAAVQSQCLQQCVSEGGRRR